MWNLGDNGGNPVTLVAHWFAANTYTVLYNKNDGINTTHVEESLTCGVEYIIKNITEFSWTNAPYTFEGWALSSKGEKVYDVGDAKAEGLTTDKNGIIDLLAVWEAPTYRMIYHIVDPENSTRVFNMTNTDIKTYGIPKISTGRDNHNNYIIPYNKNYLNSWKSSTTDDLTYVLAGRTTTKDDATYTTTGAIKYFDGDFSDRVFDEEGATDGAEIHLYSVYRKQIVALATDEEISYVAYNGNGGSIDGYRKIVVPLKKEMFCHLLIINMYIIKGIKE